jgi:hypothetical protein
MTQIQDLLVTAGEDQLYESLARDLPARVVDQVGGGAALKLSSPLEFGRKFYQTKIRPQLHAAICVKANYCKNAKKYGGAAKVVALVAGAAAEYVEKALGLPSGSAKGSHLVIAISATVLKEGLNKLCECA